MLKYLNDGELSTTIVLIVVHMFTLFMISHCFFRLGHNHDKCGSNYPAKSDKDPYSSLKEYCNSP